MTNLVARWRMAVGDSWTWRKARIEELDGRAGECLAPVCDLLEDQFVRPAELRGSVAWGQFLDSGHHSEEQWGHFGTSAALQVFAIAHHWDGEERSVYQSSPVRGVTEALPESPPADDASTPKQEDFQDPLKLAFMIDACRLDEVEERVQGTQPELVDHLLSLSLSGNEGWSTRGTVGDPSRQDRLLVTAFGLRSLRRFPVAQQNNAVEGAWDWLATQLRRRARLLGGDVLALGCLALESAPQTRRTANVSEAAAAVRAELVSRHGGESCPAIDRPYFNPYSRGEVNDYVFLSPEMLTALLFLEADERPREIRGFALEVVGRIVDQIETENRHSSNPEGFRVQRGMLGTVDQMWAIRVLFAFHRAYRRNPATLRPASRIVLGSGVIGVPLLIAIIVLGVFFGGWIGSAVSVILGAVLSAFIAPYVVRR
ncbi:MAG: hypothetical protein JSS68_10665 [Actinobacteria bacterium]|nr:hypothetical protein [Actinomycetota bacterium]